MVVLPSARVSHATKAVAALTALAALLRFATLDAKSFWLDEVYTVELLDHDFSGMLATISETESTPPLYYVLAWAWTRLFGLGEVGVRSLSALLGTALVVVGYLAARELVSQRAALVAAALLAVNPLLIWYSQDARAYELLALLGALSFLFFVRALEGRRNALAWWSLTSALAVTSHYFALFLVAAEAAWLASARERRRSVALGLVPVLAVSAALAPLALAQGGGERAAWIGEVSLAWRVGVLPANYLIGFEAPSPILAAAGAAVAGGAGLWLLIARCDERERRGALVAAGIGLAALGLPLVLALAGIDYFLHRYLLAALLPLVVALAAGLGARRAGLAGPLAASGLCALSLAIVAATAWQPKLHSEDWRGAAEALGPVAGSRAIVVTPGRGMRPLKIYLGAEQMAPGAASVEEIALVGLAPPVTGSIDRESPPRPDTTPSPAPDFEQVERVEAETFTLVRFRATAPVRVEPDQLAASRIGDTTPSVLLER